MPGSWRGGPPSCMGFQDSQVGRGRNPGGQMSRRAGRRVYCSASPARLASHAAAFGWPRHLLSAGEVHQNRLPRTGWECGPGSGKGATLKRCRQHSCEFCSGVDASSGKDVAQMSVHRAHRDAQFLRNGFVRQTCGNQRSNLLLPARQL